MALIKAYKWREQMNKKGWFIDDIAKNEGLSREYVGKVLRMNYLLRIS